MRATSQTGFEKPTMTSNSDGGIDDAVTRHRVAIASEMDIINARKLGREFAQQLGFGPVDCAEVATVISELARNIVLYAGRGTISICPLCQQRRVIGIEILAEDQGPGIEDLEEAARDGFSTSGSLGLGLPGARRLVDRFELHSRVGKGTRVRAVKELRI
jgi:serine/threonine-protein kinase RsbT